jgi:hypothetical protein
VGNGSTCALSSGVEGVTGDGEREREAEEGDMGEIKKARGILACSLFALNAEETRPRFRRISYHLFYL